MVKVWAGEMLKVMIKDKVVGIVRAIDMVWVMVVVTVGVTGLLGLK